MADHPSNYIFSESKKQSWHLWFFAVFWNSLVWFAIVMGGGNILKAFDSNPIFYFFVSFPFIGLWLLILAIKETRAWYKFGKTPIVIDPFPGQVGGRFSGYLDLPLSPDNAKHAILSLSCLHKYERHDNRGERFQHENIIWQDRLDLIPDSLGNNTRINFLFNSPSDLPASEDESDNYHAWQLHVCIALPGIDYDRIFFVPMAIASEQQLTSTERYRANISQQIAHQDTNVATVPEIKNTASGLQLYYGYGRSLGMAMVLIIISSFIGIFGYYFFDGFLGFLPATTILMAVSVGFIAFLFGVFGVLLLANSLTIEIDVMGVRKKQRFFGFLLEEFTNASDIVDITIDQSASSGGGKSKRVWYRLKLLTADGQDIEVGDSLEGQSYAREIREKMIGALGAHWQAAAIMPQQEKVKKSLPWWLQIIGKLLSYSFVFALLYDMSIKIPFISKFLGEVFK